MTSDCKVTLSGNSLSIDKELTYEEWENVGKELFKIEAGWQWWVGDWINYGGAKYGDTYTAAIAVTGKGKQTLLNIASVAYIFQTSRRREVSFRHHTEVQGLDHEDQDRFLDQAVIEGWSCAELRKRVKEFKGESSQEEGLPTGDEYEDMEEDDLDTIASASINLAPNKLTVLIEAVRLLPQHEFEVFLSAIACVISPTK